MQVWISVAAYAHYRWYGSDFLGRSRRMILAEKRHFYVAKRVGYLARKGVQRYTLITTEKNIAETLQTMPS